MGNKQIERIRNIEKESRKSRLIVREKISLELKAQRSKKGIQIDYNNGAKSSWRRRCMERRASCQNLILFRRKLQAVIK